MDFYRIKKKKFDRGSKKDFIEIYPDFIVCRSKDLMVRGRSFYAVWDDSKGLWSTDEYDVARLVDQDLREYSEDLSWDFPEPVLIRSMSDFESNSWNSFKKYVGSLSDNSVQLDNKLTFLNDEVKKTDYVSKRLPYSLLDAPCPAWDELVSTLYDPKERDKIEWAIGSIIAGDSKDIQKFLVLYGSAGSGKSTILKVIQQLFEGYYTIFEAKALGSSSNSFSTEVFKNNPLVAIQHDGDLSRIEDNTKLNSIISHEDMLINEKYKSGYVSRINCFLFMATNRPVKITDARSGIIRRLIDVNPSGRRIPPVRYQALMTQISFELGAIANFCLNKYRKMGKNYYNGYRPIDMMLRTDLFYNFVEANYFVFKEDDGTTLKKAYDMYKNYCSESSIAHIMPYHIFRDELKNYFKIFYPITRVDGKQVRSYYQGFLSDKFATVDVLPLNDEHQSSLVLDQDKSLLDEMCGDCPAQYANKYETPSKQWEKVKTTLSELDTRKIHYVKLPKNHIVIDFDLKNELGEKDAEKNLIAASHWPPTYAEFSKGGSGIHLHYIYEGDPDKLSRLYSEGIEIKVFNGNGSLRRRLTKCNNIPVAKISSGLPLKVESKVVNFEAVKSEKGLRSLITRNLNKEIHSATKPSVDFIYKILDDAYNSGLKYDISDMRPAILAFANNSTHQADYCVKLVAEMPFKSEETSEAVEDYDENTLVFFDVEVFPNLFLVNWKYAGEDHKCVRMINPTSQDIEQLMKMRLIGFNCRRYDNHIVYARYLGYDNEQLYRLSTRLINGSNNATFGEAYNLSYTDVYDFASAGNKKSLKKFEIELGIHHQELGLPWDQPVPEDKWIEVAEYCDNDVIATEAVFNHLQGDWTARQILAELSGLSVNDTTNRHSTKIIFGEDKHPQDQFVYTDLSEMFPGYKFDAGKSTYRGEEVGEGGYVYSEPGMYVNVALLDIASMHPTSVEQLNLFGDKYTKRFSEIKQARIAIKHKDIGTLKNILDGKLVPFVENSEYDLKDLSDALKTVINSVYGLTSAKFDNAFRDKRNKDNIVAKRGALFMVDLKHAVQEKGYTVAHIKTDSIKIPNADDEIIQFVMEFGKKYGYNFEHEATYDRMCLVNKSVYIARYRDGDKLGDWTATGAQFAQSYIFKTLFSHEPITIRDRSETKAVTTSIYLDFNEDLPEDEHNYHFVGKVGLFCPIKPGCGGGLLLREKDGKYDAVVGTKGYRWMESEVVKELEKEDDIDDNYYRKLVDEAVNDISKYGDFEWFISDEPVDEKPPWCTNRDIPSCDVCPEDKKCTEVIRLHLKEEK